LLKHRKRYSNDIVIGVTKEFGRPKTNLKKCDLLFKIYFLNFFDTKLFIKLS